MPLQRGWYVVCHDRPFFFPISSLISPLFKGGVNTVCLLQDVKIDLKPKDLTTSWDKRMHFRENETHQRGNHNKLFFIFQYLAMGANFVDPD